MNRSAFNRRAFLASSALAVAPLALPAAAFAQAQAPAPAVQPIEALDNGLIAIMKAGSQHQSFMQRYQMLKPVVEQAFNLPQILQISVGLEWSQIPAAQQAQLQQVFRQYTVAAYVHSFDGYNGQSFRILGARPLGAQRIVDTELVPRSGDPTKLSYVMTNAGGQWKATDILFNGTISKVATQRSDFSSLVSPGNATRLITELQRKVAYLSGGALKS